MNTPQETFSSRAQEYRQQGAQFKQLVNRWAGYRLASFAASLVAITYLANTQHFYALLAVVAVGVFLFASTVKRHNKFKASYAQALGLAGINETEELRMASQLHNLEDDGQEFFSKGHSYDLDLDLFGTHSLWQLTNRGHTPTGRQALANWLLGQQLPHTLAERQEAVKELGAMLQWRQDFEVAGVLNKHEKNEKEPADTEAFRAWLETPPQISNRWYYHAVAWAIPILFFSFCGLWGIGLVPGWCASVTFLAGAAILLTVQVYALKLYHASRHQSKVLKGYAALLRHTEGTPFQSMALLKIIDKISTPKGKASQAIKQLQKILHRFDNRANMAYMILNPIFMLDLGILIRAERWKLQWAQHLAPWQEAIGELEAYCSLAGFHFAHPHYAFAQEANSPNTYKTSQMGHPLIPAAKRVNNDFDLAPGRNILMVTGSNMSGKSTFLRTVGINAVLAYAGAPACAQAITLGRFTLFTSMRTTDNLEESVSSFYAELKRLRQLLDLVEAKEPVLFLLDEILKGTNSEDRHRGAKGLVAQLHRHGAAGLVSTHDLTLGSLESRLEGVSNYSFNSEIHGDDIVFNYQLTPGLCKSFNASKLMEKIGIELG